MRALQAWHFVASHRKAGKACRPFGANETLARWCRQTAPCQFSYHDSSRRRGPTTARNSTPNPDVPRQPPVDVVAPTSPTFVEPNALGRYRGSRTAGRDFSGGASWFTGGFCDTSAQALIAAERHERECLLLPGDRARGRRRVALSHRREHAAHAAHRLRSSQPAGPLRPGTGLRTAERSGAVGTGDPAAIVVACAALPPPR